MISTLIFLQTLLLSGLPSPETGFNNSLSIVSAAPNLAMLNATDPQAEGKVIKDRQNPNKDYRIKTVVIDAGHGGHDPGCLGGHSQEKHLVLAIAKELAASMEAQFSDIRVIMTRDKDVFVPLHERARIANHAGADLFISIHCNFMPNSGGTHGSETYVMGLHTAEHNLEVAKRENAVILLEDDYEKNYDYDPNSPEGHIMLTMYQNAYLEQSILFAERVEDKIKTKAQRRSRGVKQAGFVVLKETAMPSVLIESGFLSNRYEEAYLETPEGQQQIALAILDAFAEYKGLIEGTSVAGEIIPVAANKAGQSSEPTPAKAESTSQVITDPFQPIPGPSGIKEGTPVQASLAATDAAGKATNSTSLKETLPGSRTETDTSEEPQAFPSSGASSLFTPGTSNSGWQPVGEQIRNDLQSRSSQPQLSDAGAESNIQFCVQLAASPKLLDTSSSKWKDLSYQVEVLHEGNMYKYQARAFGSLHDAMTARFSLRASGFTDAFIVAYKNGQRISLEQARKELGE
jgi:N-acetylmuramoyl-L-alanine amidase